MLDYQGRISSDAMVNGKGYTVQVIALRRVEVAKSGCNEFIVKRLSSLRAQTVV